MRHSNKRLSWWRVTTEASQGRQ